MLVYIVLDNSKDCYDAGGVFHAVFSSKEDAEEEVLRFGKEYAHNFEIEEFDV